MEEGYVTRNQKLPHFITLTVVDWIDVFSRKVYRDEVIASLDYCIKNKGMVLYGYVIMSNHIHMVIQSSEGKLSDLIRDFKKFTARAILIKIETEPESRREWMLERFEWQLKVIREIKYINSGNMAIIRKKFIPIRLCGQN
jgi:REP element-mobilizing transposase RayT